MDAAVVGDAVEGRVCGKNGPVINMHAALKLDLAGQEVDV